MRKILLVDDHNLIFGGLKDTIKHFILEYAASTETALQMINESRYYAVILDITIGEKKGFDIIRNIPKTCYVFMLTMHKSSVYIQMAREMGANGYFLKDESPELLITALNHPIERRFWMSGTVEKELLNAGSYRGSKYDLLSPREQQVFTMLAEDLSYIEIANRLKLSRKTVNNHRDHIMKKLEIETQVGLVREALRLGIISLQKD